MEQRTLEQWLSYLEQLHPTEIDMGLDRIKQVATQLALTKPAAKVVTVTGTNGKGSTCALIADLLSAQKVRVGVYSSPHLLRYNERVSILGVPVTDQQLCEAFTAVEQARAELSLTYFEYGTLAALWLFERAELDVAVLEVGLGGRLDAVNIVDADLAIITSIALDHSDWLGDSRESVAREKSGILRGQQIALSADLDPPAVIQQTAEKLATTLLQRDQQYGYQQQGESWSVWGLDSQQQPFQLAGLPAVALPKANLASAVQAVFSLGYSLSAALLKQRLAVFSMPGRVEPRVVDWQGKQLNILLDVGHNPLAANFLQQYLMQFPVAGKRYAVFGLLKDKDMAGVIDPLLPQIDQWQVVTLPCGRTQQASELAGYLQQKQAAHQVQTNVAAALSQVFSQATAQDQIIIFGSFFTVAAAAQYLETL